MSGPITGKEQQVALDQLWETLKTKGEERIKEIRGESTSGSIIDCELPNGDVVKLTKDACGKQGGTEALRGGYIDRIIADLKETAKSVNSNPRIHKARNTEWISMKYGILRKAAKSQKNEFTLKDYDRDSNYLGLNKKIFKGNGGSISYDVDANMYIGVTKASIMEAISDDMAAPNSEGQKVAAFSMAIKKLKWKQNYIENSAGARIEVDTGYLTMTFHNMPDSNTAIPSANYSAYIPLSLSEKKYDDNLITLGRYVNPGESSMDSFMNNFLEAWNFEVMNNMSALKANGLARMLQTSKDEVVSTQFLCCILFEFLKGFPDIGEYIKTHNLDPNNMSAFYIWMLEREKDLLVWRKETQQEKLSDLQDNGLSGLDKASLIPSSYELEEDLSVSTGDESAQLASAMSKVQLKIVEINDKIAKIDEDIEYYKNNPISLQEILDEQQDWLRGVRQILVVTLSLVTNSAFQFAFPSLKFNMIEWMLSMIYIILVTMLDEIQKWSMQEALEWVKQKKKEVQDIYDEEGEDNGFCTDPERAQGASANDAAYREYLRIKNDYEHGVCVGAPDISYQTGIDPNRTRQEYKASCTTNGGTWVAPKDRCEDAGYAWNSGANLKTAAIACLPWEQILLVMVQAIFGKEGLFKNLKAFVDRMQRQTMAKHKARGIGAEDEKSWLDNIIPVLEGAIAIIDYLLALNLEAMQTCLNMSPGQILGSRPQNEQELIQCTLTDANGVETMEKMTRQDCQKEGGVVAELIACNIDGVISQMTVAECEEQKGSEVATPDSSTTTIIMGTTTTTGTGDLSSEGNMQFTPSSPTSYSTSGKLDITGTSIDPLAMLVFQDGAAISNFLMQNMGLSTQEAAEAVAGAKKGECLKSLTTKEVEQLETILNKVGMEL